MTPGNQVSRTGWRMCSAVQTSLWGWILRDRQCLRLESASECFPKSLWPAPAPHLNRCQELHWGCPYRWGRRRITLLPAFRSIPKILLLQLLHTIASIHCCNEYCSPLKYQDKFFLKLLFSCFVFQTMLFLQPHSHHIGDKIPPEAYSFSYFRHQNHKDMGSAAARAVDFSLLRFFRSI